MVRQKDHDDKLLEGLPPAKKTMLANALNTIFTTAVVLTKMDTIRTTLALLGVQAQDYEDEECVTPPQILAKIVFIVNKFDATI